MSAQFWTKVLGEIKQGHNYKRWVAKSRSYEFNTETQYSTDIQDAIYDWLNTSSSKLPGITPQEENAIHQLLKQLIQGSGKSGGGVSYKGYINNMYNWGKRRKDIKCTVDPRRTWVKFVMMPTASRGHGGLKDHQGKHRQAKE